MFCVIIACRRREKQYKIIWRRWCDVVSALQFWVCNYVASMVGTRVEVGSAARWASQAGRQASHHGVLNLALGGFWFGGRLDILTSLCSLRPLARDFCYIQNTESRVHANLFISTCFKYVYIILIKYFICGCGIFFTYNYKLNGYVIIW